MRPDTPLPPAERFRPLSRRRRLLIVLLAMVTAITIVMTLLDPPGGIKRPPPGARPDRARCAEGERVDCVGGKAEVIVVAPAAAASR